MVTDGWRYRRRLKRCVKDEWSAKVELRAREQIGPRPRLDATGF
jgi:hypothetical protein